MSDFEKTGASNVETGDTQDAFDMYESGASIEEVNEKFFPDSEQESTSAADDTVNAESDDGEASDALSDDEGSAVNQAADDRNDTDAAGVDEKVFSQKDVDSILGRRIAKERQAHDLVKADYDSMVSEVAKLLGVSNDEAMSALQNENLRREAESEDVADVDLYAKLKNAERKIADMEKDARTREQNANFESFKSAITQQVSDISSVIGEDAIIKASQDSEFNSYVRFFYENEASRDTCVKRAYAAWAEGKGIPLKGADATAQSKGDEPSKSPVPKQSKNRVRENVSATVSAPDSKLDIDNFESEDFDKIYERVKSGETIRF